ncbi:MAG TPA: hypothetical protein VMV27_00805 [Candidatus Binataceae bacterium]|nr:hypothetical protein [Candidatus Binataceae bacterium]
MPDTFALAAREIFRAAYIDICWMQLARAQEFLEFHHGAVGIQPPDFFASWRLNLEEAFRGGEPWDRRAPVAPIGA